MTRYSVNETVLLQVWIRLSCMMNFWRPLGALLLTEKYLCYIHGQKHRLCEIIFLFVLFLFAIYIISFSSPLVCKPELCLGRPCFSSSHVFCFAELPFFPSASWPLSFLSLFLSFSSSSDLAWFMRDCLRWVGLLCMDALSCIHGVGRWR